MKKAQHRNLLDLNNAVESFFDSLVFLNHLNTNRCVVQLKGRRTAAERLLCYLETTCEGSMLLNFIRSKLFIRLIYLAIFFMTMPALA